jgi:hypothetical protein
LERVTSAAVDGPPALREPDPRLLDGVEDVAANEEGSSKPAGCSELSAAASAKAFWVRRLARCWGAGGSGMDGAFDEMQVSKIKKEKAA